MPQTQLYAKKSQLHVVVESTVDTYVAPAGAGAGMVLIENLNYTLQSEQFSTNFHRPDYLQADEIPGATRAQSGSRDGLRRRLGEHRGVRTRYNEGEACTG